MPATQRLRNDKMKNMMKAVVQDLECVLASISAPFVNTCFSLFDMLILVVIQWVILNCKCYDGPLTISLSYQFSHILMAFL